MSIANTILRRIRGKGKGWVFTPKDFLDLGSRAVVDKTLSRLVQGDIGIRRLSRGLYDCPKSHPKIGLLSPDPHMIAQAVGSDIQPHGASAANMLGLSTQVAAKPIFMTSDKSKTITVGNQTIQLKHTNIPASDGSDIAAITLQALLYLGKDNIDNNVVKICSSKLSDSDKTHLKQKARYAPNWMTSTIHAIAA